MAKVTTDNRHYKAIADKIRERGGTYVDKTMKPETMSDNVGLACDYANLMGFNEGEQAGLETGYQDGFSKGRDEGLTEGYDNGYVDGSQPFDKFISGELSALFNDRVTTVSERCFYANANIQSVDLPKVTTVRYGAFIRCTNLTTVNMPLLVSMEYDMSEYQNGPFSKSGLVQVDFPSLEVLCDYAFSSCTSLMAANLPKIIEIPVSAFSSCSSLTDFDFSKIVSVGNSAFSSTGLTSVNSETMTNIGGSVFNYCRSLKTVYLPNVTTSGASSFYYCSELESLVMPKLEAIPNMFCYGATKLTRFDAPVATSIGSNAFYNSGLKILVLGSQTVCSLANVNAFQNTTTNIYVPDNLVSSYKSATNWTSLASRIFPISNLEG